MLFRQSSKSYKNTAMKKVNLFLIIALFFTSFNLHSSHMKYGELKWECLNNGKYVFNLELYIQCGGGSWAFLNSTLNVSGSSLPTDSSSNVVSQILLRPDSTKWIADNYGNMNPNCNSAISNGTLDCSNYTWKKYYYQSDPIYLNGTPPMSGWAFTWVTPCCRPSLTNVAGFSSVASPVVAKMYKNSSTPNQCFNSSPDFMEPIHEPYHCKGELSVNYGAIDQESDSLVYHFEQLNVNFAQGYSYTNPLPDSNFNSLNRRAVLNPNTGLLNARVENIGDYIINVRVDEWRSGELIASVNRERIFSIKDCPTLINNNPNNLPDIYLGMSSNAYHKIKVKAGDSIQLVVGVNDTNTTVSSNGLQLVSLFPMGSLFAADFQDTSNCQNPPCATLSNQIPVYDTTEKRFSVNSYGAAISNFNWKTACNHLTDSGNAKKHYFYFSTKDDHCFLPAVNHSVLEVEVEPLLVNGVQNLNDTLKSLDTVQYYQWYDCINDTVITGANSPNYLPSQNGSYAVILQNGSCVDTSDCFQYTTVGLLNNEFNHKVKVYPNPTEGLIIIGGDDFNEIEKVMVYNIHGQLIQEVNILNSDNHQLNLNGGAGIYFIELINKEGSVDVFKIVKN